MLAASWAAAGSLWSDFAKKMSGYLITVASTLYTQMLSAIYYNLQIQLKLLLLVHFGLVL